jgi:hypothetical protein
MTTTKTTKVGKLKREWYMRGVKDGKQEILDLIRNCSSMTEILQKIKLYEKINIT